MKTQPNQIRHAKSLRIFLIVSLIFVSQIQFLSYGQTANFNSKEELHKKYIELRQSLVSDFMLGVGPDEGFSIPAWRQIWQPSIWWGDGPMHLGYYVGLLAMEYKLLSDNQLPTDQTVRELFYALNAIDRLDFNAESYYYIPGTTTKGTPSLNGFLIRDDISNVTQNQIDALNTNPNLLDINGWKSDYHENLITAQTTGDIHAMSKDHCAYLCSGLALAIKFLPATLQYYENGVAKSLPDFSGASTYSSTLRGEAINIMNRIVDYLLNSSSLFWNFKNPVTNEAISLGGDVWDLSWGFSEVQDVWAGSSTYNPGILAQTAFHLLFNPAVVVASNQQKRMFLNLAAASNCLVDGASNTTMETLLDTYLDPNGIYDFEYIPPLNYVLFQDFYDNGGGSVGFNKQDHASVLYSLITQLNCIGNPHDYTPDPTVYGLPASVPPGYGAYEWSSCGRLIEPQGRGKTWTATQHSWGDFNGIDWMFFYNLYCLLQDDNQQYFCVTERLSPTVAVGQSTTTTIDQPTYHFLPLEVEGTFIINSTAVSAQPNAIFTGKECDITPNQLTILSGGKVQLGSLQNAQSGYLQIDNGAALVIKSGATLELNQNSILSLMAGSILIVESGATIHLKGTALVDIHDHAHVCIDPGAIFVLENSGNRIEFQDYAVIGGDAQTLCQTCNCAIPQELSKTGNGDFSFDCSFFMDFTMWSSSITGSNVQWNNLDEKVNSEFIVMPGAMLTISNSTLEFTGDGAIYVARGGKLIVDNTILTNNALCPQAFWKGIQVAGNTNEPQSNLSEQGYVEIRNNSEIHRAECGIITNNSFYDAIPCIGPPNNNSGGIIKIRDSYFYNNIIGVELLPYNKINPTTGADIPNVCEIRNTVFETDDPLLNPEAFIKLQEVHGVKILGNQFINSTPIMNHDFSLRGTGIDFYRASAFVQDYGYGPALPPGGGYMYYDPNIFEGLYYGIYRKNVHRMGGTSATFYPRPTKIDHCQFQNCFRSVYLWCGIGDVVTRNSFAVPAANLLTSEYPYGLYLNYSKGYHVEGNLFEMGMISPYGLNDKGNFGIIVNNSFEEHNELYNNVFDDIQFAINAQNNNRSLPLEDYEKGLQIKCNDFSDCLNDIVVTASQTGPLGIAKFQGFNATPSSPAGNTFSFASTNAWSDFNNYGVTNNPGAGVYFPNTYYHHSVDPANYCNPTYNWRPCYFDGQTTYPNNTLFGFDKPNVCHSKIQTGVPNYSAMLASLQGHQQAIASLDMTLQIILDGGNTEGLSTRIQLALPWESYQVFGELVAQSPNISEDVMMQAINAVDLFSASMIKSLMLMNPHNILSAEVMEALYNRSVPLPEYMLYEIMNSGDQPTPVRSLKAELAYLSRNYADTVHQIRRYYLLDTSEVNNTEMLLALDHQIDDVSNGWHHAWFLFEIMGIDSAMAALQKIENDFPLTDAEYTIQQEYSNLMTITQWCNEHADTLESMDPQWLSYLNDVAQSRHHFSAAMAIALLEHLNPEFHYEEEILLPSYSTLRRLPAVAEETPKLTIFPNPATDHLNVMWETDASNSILQIIDATGRVVAFRELSGKRGDYVLNTEQLQSGVYVMQLMQKNTILASTRFVKAN